MHMGHVVELLQRPSAETYLPLLHGVIAHPDFTIRSDAMRDLWQRYKAGGDVERVRAEAAELTPLWIHSPELHLLLNAIAKQTGDAKTAQIETRFTQCCFQGLLALGDGSAARPFQVARVQDEYLLLNYLKIDWKQQSMVQRDHRVIDIFARGDGTEVHFQLPKADLLTGKALL